MNIFELIIILSLLVMITLGMVFIMGIRLDIGEHSGFHFTKKKHEFHVSYIIPWVLLDRGRVFMGIISGGRHKKTKRKVQYFRVQISTMFDFIHSYEIELGRFYLRFSDYSRSQDSENKD